MIVIPAAMGGFGQATRVHGGWRQKGGRKWGNREDDSYDPKNIFWASDPMNVGKMTYL